jgi:hypothetical protein
MANDLSFLYVYEQFVIEIVTTSYFKQHNKQILIVVLPCILISKKLSFQQRHYLLKHKMLQFLFECFFTQLLHVSVPLDHHQGAHITALLKLQSL